MSEGYAAAVAGWFADLRSGDASTWAAWLSDHPQRASGATLPRASSLQLELVRRLAADPPPRFAGLADLVAATPAWGRGRGDLPLPWPQAPAFGPPALAPEDLPAEELLRVAAPVLAGLAARLPDIPPAPEPPRRRRWRRGVVVSGPARQALALRHQLRAAGLRDGGRNATRVVLVEPFESGMYDLWTSRVTEGGTVRWRRFWQIRRRADRVPPSLDGPALVRAAAGPGGRGRVHAVVTADHAAAERALSTLFGTRLTLPDRPAWAHIDLIRMLNRVTEARATPARRRMLGEKVLALLDAADGETPGVPRPHRAWAKGQAIGLAADVEELVTAGGYPVHGNIADLVGAGDDKEAGATVRTSADQTLEAALCAIRAAWARVGPEGGGR